MFSVTKEFSFSSAHRLLNYEGPCKNLHGHNYRCQITIQSTTVDGMGMVLDFSELKTRIIKRVMFMFDHKLIICQDDPDLHTLIDLTDHTIVPYNVTAENMAQHIYSIANSNAEGAIGKVVRVKLWETDTSFAEYAPCE